MDDGVARTPGGSEPLRRRLPLGLAGLIVLVGVVESLEVRRDYAFTSYHAASWKATSQQLRSMYARVMKGKSREPELLVFGDSLIKFGVYPKVVEAVSGRPALNLAITCGPTPASYFLFRRVLESGGRPRAILIDSAEGVLDAGPRSEKRPYPWADLLSLRETFELSYAARDPDFFIQVVLRKVLHSYKSRFELREHIVKAFEGESSWLRITTLGFLRNWKLNLGAQVNPKWDFKEADYPPDSRQLPGTWAADAVNRRYLEQTFRLAREHGVAVFWLLPPYHPFTQSWSRYVGEERRFIAFVHGMQTRHPEVVVLDARYSGYDRSVFYDAAHLDIDGAVALSTSVAQVVNAHLDDPGNSPTSAMHWVKIPSYRLTQPNVPLENVWSSRDIAVKEGTPSVRR